MSRKARGIIQRMLYTYDPSDPSGRKLSLGVYILRSVFVIMLAEFAFYIVLRRNELFEHKHLMELFELLNNLFLFGAGGVFGIYTGGNVVAKKYGGAYTANGGSPSPVGGAAPDDDDSPEPEPPPAQAAKPSKPPVKIAGSEKAKGPPGK